MARPKKNHVQLSDNNVKQLKHLIKQKDTNQTTVNRCRILLALDENNAPAWSYDQCVEAYGVSKTTISTVIKAFSNGGIDSVLERKRSINSDNARRKVDGRTATDWILRVNSISNKLSKESYSVPADEYSYVKSIYDWLTGILVF